MENQEAIPDTASVGEKVLEKMEMLRYGEARAPKCKFFATDPHGVVFCITVETARKEDTHPKCFEGIYPQEEGAHNAL
jgi:hypothetical protein